MPRLERRLSALEGSGAPLVVRIASFRGVIGEPVRITTVGANDDCTRAQGETVTSFRLRADVEAAKRSTAKLIVLKEQNAAHASTQQEMAHG